MAQKKKRFCKVKLNVIERRIVWGICTQPVENLTRKDNSPLRDARENARQAKLYEVLDLDAVDAFFEKYDKRLAKKRKEVQEEGRLNFNVPEEWTHGETEEFEMKVGLYSWIRKRMEKGDFHNLSVRSCKSACAAFGIEFDDSDLWDDDELIDGVEIIEKEEDENE